MTDDTAPLDPLAVLTELHAAAAQMDPDEPMTCSIPAGDLVAMCEALADPVVAGGGSEPSRTVLNLVKVGEDYTEREECGLVHVSLDGPAVELGPAVFLAFTKLRGGETQAVLGYNLPDLAEAYYHPLHPEARVYVLDGAIVIDHPDLVLTDRGLHEPPREAGDEATASPEVVAPPEQTHPWLLTIYAEEDGEDVVLDLARFRRPANVRKYLREVLSEQYAENPEHAIKAEVKLEQDGEGKLPGIKLTLVDTREDSEKE